MNRGPLWGHLGTMVVLLLVLGLLTFAPPPTSPPAIAEIAPAAVEQIKQAPVEQAVDTGGPTGSLGARGGPGPGRSRPSVRPSLSGLPSAAPDAPEVPSPFTCVGKLPRQIEDPQSPPCVPFFQGDNGGATHQGVTRDSITVVVPDFPAGYGVLRAYEGFFNRRFQLYGRKLRLIGTANEFDPNADEASSQQALAAKADQEHKAFATLTLSQFQGTTYYRELARREVMSVTAYSPYTESMLRELAPYVWQYAMALDRIMETAGDWLCDRFVGRAATYTKDTDLIGKPRVFGLIHQDTSGNRFRPDILQRAAKACGASFAVVKHLEHNNQREHTDAAEYSENPAVRSAVLSMKEKGVTSVLCLCAVNVLGPVGEFAGRQKYFPEWLVASYLGQEVLVSQHLNNTNSGQKEGLVGISMVPRLLRAADDPALWALREQDPSAFVQGRDDQSGIRQVVLHNTYRALLLLASGIQLAGPRLTPQTFEAGLQRTTFPNPESPLQPGRVGFAGGSHAMTTDAAEFWWSNSAPSPYLLDGSPGTWCYADRGTRRRGGTWPGDPSFQQGLCDSGR